MPSDTDAGCWKETRVGKTCSPASHIRSDRTPFDSVPKMTPPSCQTLSQGIIMGLWLRPWDKTIVFTMEDAVVTSAEESEASPVKCQDNSDRFLWRRGSGASRVSSPTPDHVSDCLHNRSATPSRCSSSGTASQMVFWYVASAARQCAMPRGPECQGILGQAQHPRGSPPALLTGIGPLRLLPLPQAEDHPEEETISRRRGNTTKYDTEVAGHFQTSVPDMHWKVEGSLESLHTIWRVVLWRR
jgi:hypothetical protein